MSLAGGYIILLLSEMQAAYWDSIFGACFVTGMRMDSTHRQRGPDSALVDSMKKGSAVSSGQPSFSLWQTVERMVKDGEGLFAAHC